MYVYTHVGPYLILVTEKKFVGTIEGHSIYEVKGTELLSFSKTNIHLSESQVSHGCRYFCFQYVDTFLLTKYMPCSVTDQGGTRVFEHPSQC